MFDQACKLQYGEQRGVFERKRDVHECVCVCVSLRHSGGGEGGNVLRVLGEKEQLIIGMYKLFGLLENLHFTQPRQGWFTQQSS